MSESIAEWRHSLGTDMPEPPTDDELAVLDSLGTPYEDYFGIDLLMAYRLGKAAR